MDLSESNLARRNSIVIAVESSVQEAILSDTHLINTVQKISDREEK